MRDCESCKNHTDKGCTKWKCEFEPTTKNASPKYCDRSICLKNEYNNVGCEDCEVTKSQEPTAKNDLEVASGLEKNSKKLEKDFGELDCISRADAIHAVSEALKRTFVEYEDIANKVIGKLPSVTPQESKTGHCRDCKWWKDSDGVYRRGVRAESQCPINRKEVYEGNGYCFLYEPQESEAEDGECI